MQRLRELAALRLLPLILTVVMALLLFSLGAAIGTRYWLVLPKLREMEAQADRKDLRRVLLAIDAKKQQLSALAYDNAMWDGLYDFVTHPNQEFFDSTFPVDTLVTFNIDLLAIFDSENRLVARRIADDKQALPSAVAVPVDDLKPHLVDLQQVRERALIFNSGVMRSARGAMVYAVASIVRSDKTGTPRGNLLFATDFDRELLEEVKENAQVKVSFEPAAPNAVVRATPDDVYRDDHDQLRWVLTDAQRHPVIQLVLTLPQRDYETTLWVLPVLVAFLFNFFGAAVMLLLFHFVLIRPLGGIGEYLRKLRADGDYSRRIDSTQANELGDLSRDINALVQHVQVQQQQLQAQAAEMQALSFQDGLTGLANRRRFDQALADNWALMQRAQMPLALVMFDVDYFKNYNDHYGHQRGDEVLRQLGELLRQVTERQSDLAARYGGEEFAILLPETNEAGAWRIAMRLQNDLHNAAIQHEHSAIGPLLTISIGICALIPSAQTTKRDLIRQADAALYSSKAAGRNTITLASQLPS